MKTGHFIAVVLLLGASFNAAFGAPTDAQKNRKCIELLDKIPTRMDVWRYHGQPDFNSPHHVELEFDQQQSCYSARRLGSVVKDSYYPKGSGLWFQIRHPFYPTANIAHSEMNSGSHGADLLARNQSFPLVVMEKTNYITPEVRKAQEDISNRLLPNQVTFFEITESFKKDELEIMYGQVPENARRDEREVSFEQYWATLSMGDENTGVDKSNKNPTYNLKVAASWLISGQLGEVRKLKLLALPLENGELEVPIDRRKYKYIWEVGRAAQIRPGSFEETLRASAYFAYYELLLSGGKLEDAYVFAHSLDPLHTQHYVKKYGMKLHSSYNGKGNPDEVSLMIPLKKLMTKLGPGSFSSQGASLQKASRGELKSIEAQSLAIKIRQRANYYLTERAPTAGIAPVVVAVRDFSNGLNEQVTHLVSHLSDSTRSEAAHLLSSTEPSVEFRDFSRKYLEETGHPYQTHIRGNPEPLVEFLRKNNAVELESKALSGPDAATQAKRILMGAYYEYIEKLRALGVADPENRIRELGIQFAITNTNTGDSQAFRNLGPNTLWYIHRAAFVSTHKVFYFTLTETLVTERIVESLCFSVAQIEKMIKTDSALASTVKASSFGLGSDHYHRFMSDPELFSP